jgi:hypothetical protein
MKIEKKDLDKFTGNIKLFEERILEGDFKMLELHASIWDLEMKHVLYSSLHKTRYGVIYFRFFDKVTCYIGNSHSKISLQRLDIQEFLKTLKKLKKKKKKK